MLISRSSRCLCSLTNGILVERGCLSMDAAQEQQFQVYYVVVAPAPLSPFSRHHQAISSAALSAKRAVTGQLGRCSLCYSTASLASTTLLFSGVSDLAFVHDNYHLLLTPILLLLSPSLMVCSFCYR